MAEPAAAVDWRAWQRSWDRQQEWYLPDREERFRVMLDAVEALAGDRPQVLDLACGTGSVTDRVLRRLPGARCTGVDLDPALLTIARGTFADEPRAAFVRADLTDPDWPAALPRRTFDAVLTSTALHWLDAGALRELYGRLAGLIRPGGVFLNADHMPDQATPRISAALHAHDAARRERAGAAGALDWAGWWRTAAEAPELREAVRERFALLGNPVTGESDHAQDHLPDAAGHLAALRAAGFAEARTVWSSATDAVVLALR